MVREVLSRESIAQALDVSIDVVKRWEDVFGEFLSPRPNDTKDVDRVFQRKDLYVLAFLARVRDWQIIDAGEDFSDIFASLNSGEQFGERYVRFVYSHTSVFQELPPDLGETHKHGVLFGGMTPQDILSFARSYKQAGDTLVQSALESGAPYELTYPILYSYRHAIEIYLKAIVKPAKLNHNLASLVKQFNQKYNRKLSWWAQNLLDQFHDIDEKSTAFRYGERLPDEEYWIDLNQLRDVMDVLCKGFEELAS